MLTHRRVHHHGPLVSALVLQLFARLACGPHNHGLRSTVSVSFRAPWWGRDRGFPHGYGCSVGAQPLAFHQQCCGSHCCHDSGGSERYVALCARSWWIVVFGGGLRHSAAHREPFLPPLPPNVVEIYLATRGRRPPGPHEARAVAAWAFCGLCRLAYTLPSLETRETAAQAFCALCLGAYSSPSLEARETAAQAFCSLGRGAYSPPLPSRDAIDGGAGIPRHVPWSVLPPRPSRGVIDGGAGVLWPGARGVLPPSLSGCGRWRRRRSAAWSVGRTIPRPSWGPGDGGAGDVRPEPRGVLPPFPLAVQSTAAQAICSLNRGRTPPLTFIGCGRWRRGFYSRGRGAYSPPFPSGCGRRWRGQSAACRPNPSRPGRCSTPSLGSGRARGDVRDEE